MGLSKSGWWFQTFFPIIYGIILPIDFHIFQRGRYTTNQKYMYSEPDSESVWIIEKYGFSIRRSEEHQGIVDTSPLVPPIASW